MAWVGYRGPNRVVSKFGKTLWNCLTDDGEIDRVYFVEVDVESEIEFFKKDENYVVKESLKEKVSKKARKVSKAARTRKTRKKPSRASSSTDVSAAPRSRTQPSRPAET